MIHVQIERDIKGVLHSCVASGHAGYARRGSDVVCSSVTVLIRTTLQMLELVQGIELKTNIPFRGYISFKVNMLELSSDTEQRLIFAGDFLETGLGIVSKEYPDFVQLQKKAV